MTAKKEVQTSIFDNPEVDDPKIKKEGQATFFNTVKASGDELDDLKNRANSVQEKVKHFFTARPGMEFTPIEVHQALVKANKKILLTAVRRSITDLTAQGYLLKTDKKKKEKYNAPNFFWTVNQEKKEEDEV